MIEEKEKKLSEIACKLSSLTFVLHGCCSYYEGIEPDLAKLVDFTELLDDISNELFELL